LRDVPLRDRAARWSGGFRGQRNGTSADIVAALRQLVLLVSK
jgi:hypothetical protein